MNLPDIINGGFEALGSLMILNNCRVAWRDKAVAGVSVFSTAFFTAWGAWNLYYYPSLGQWASFCGGVAIVISNSLWVSLLWRYRRR